MHSIRTESVRATKSDPEVGQAPGARLALLNAKHPSQPAAGNPIGKTTTVAPCSASLSA